MVTLRSLLAVFALGCAAGACAQVVPPGTYRAVAGNEELHVTISADGAVDIADPRSGRRNRGQNLFATQRGITGLLPGGESYTIGPGGSGLQMSLGQRLYALSPFSPPAAPRAEQPRTLAGSSIALAGVSLVSAQGMSGYRELRTLDFCSNGSFFLRVEELQSSQAGRASGVRNESGSWRLAGDFLELRYASSGGARHALERLADDVVALDGRRYTVERSTRCR